MDSRWSFPDSVWLGVLLFLPIIDVERFRILCHRTEVVSEGLGALLWKHITTRFSQVAVDQDDEFETVEQQDSFDTLNALLHTWNCDWFAFWGDDVDEVDTYPKDSANPDDLYVFRPAMKLLDCGVVIPGQSSWFYQISSCGRQTPDAEQESAMYKHNFHKTFCKAVFFAKKLEVEAKKHKLYCQSEGASDLYPFVMYTSHLKAESATNPTGGIPMHRASALTTASTHNDTDSGNESTPANSPSTHTNGKTNDVKSSVDTDNFKTVADLMVELCAHTEIAKLSAEAFPDTSFRKGPPPKEEFMRIFGDPDGDLPNSEEEAILTKRQKVSYELFAKTDPGVESVVTITFCVGAYNMDPAPTFCLKVLEGGWLSGIITGGTHT